MPNRPSVYRPAKQARPLPRRRTSASSRGYDRQWRKRREYHLRNHPWCVACRAAGRATAATVVDHRTPHKGDAGLFWDPANLQSLCASCHGRKTARTDGGFGRPIARQTARQVPQPPAGTVPDPDADG